MRPCVTETLLESVEGLVELLTEPELGTRPSSLVSGEPPCWVFHQRELFASLGLREWPGSPNNESLERRLTSWDVGTTAGGQLPVVVRVVRGLLKAGLSVSGLPDLEVAPLKEERPFGRLIGSVKSSDFLFLKEAQHSST